MNNLMRLKFISLISNMKIIIKYQEIKEKSETRFLIFLTLFHIYVFRILLLKQ
jgi:hypothetical protein